MTAFIIFWAVVVGCVAVLVVKVARTRHNDSGFNQYN